MEKAGPKRAPAHDIPRMPAGENQTELAVLTFLLRLLKAGTGAGELAERLLARFETFAGVLDTPAEVLLTIPGMHANTAGALAAYPDIQRVYLESKQHSRMRIVDTASAFEAVRRKFIGRKTEIVVLLLLDSKGYLQYMNVVSEGSVHGVPLYIRDIVHLSLLYGADAAYIAHNHPSGNCAPSKQDITATKEIELVLSGVDVVLSDHFIFTDDDFLSMRATGVLQRLRQDIAAYKRQIIK